MSVVMKIARHHRRLPARYNTLLNRTLHSCQPLCRASLSHTSGLVFEVLFVRDVVVEHLRSRAEGFHGAALLTLFGVLGVHGFAPNPACTGTIDTATIPFSPYLPPRPSPPGAWRGRCPSCEVWRRPTRGIVPGSSRRRNPGPGARRRRRRRQPRRRRSRRRRSQPRRRLWRLRTLLGGGFGGFRVAFGFLFSRGAFRVGNLAGSHLESPARGGGVGLRRPSARASRLARFRARFSSFLSRLRAFFAAFFAALRSFFSRLRRLRSPPPHPPLLESLSEDDPSLSESWHLRRVPPERKLELSPSLPLDEGEPIVHTRAPHSGAREAEASRAHIESHATASATVRPCGFASTSAIFYVTSSAHAFSVGRIKI